MCTLILAWRVLADAPVAVAANRDEATDRPSRRPEVRRGDPTVVAPRDGRAGGTWIGHNDAGVFVGISNRWLDRELDGERSRGLLVAEALERPSAAAAVASVERAVATTRHAGFNLLVADAEEATLLEWDGELATTPLEPGVHVLTNAGFDGDVRLVAGREEACRGQADVARFARERLEPDPDEPARGWLDRAAEVLASHEPAVCVHGDGYGTRSSALIALQSDGAATYRHADGPPCVTSFEPANGQS